MIHERNNKEILNFLEKKEVVEVMVIDENHFPLVALVSTTTTVNLTIALDSKKIDEYSLKPKIKKA